MLRSLKRDGAEAVGVLVVVASGSVVAGLRVRRIDRVASARHEVECGPARFVGVAVGSVVYVA